MTDTLFDQMKELATRDVAAQRAANKLCRRDDPQTSRDAAEKMVESGALNRQEQEVLAVIRATPGSAMQSYNFTTKDIARQMSGKFYLQYRHPYWKCYDICRKRFSGLHNKGLIERIPKTITLLGKTLDVFSSTTHKPVYKRRDGCCVWALKNK